MLATELLYESVLIDLTVLWLGGVVADVGPTTLPSMRRLIGMAVEAQARAEPGPSVFRKDTDGQRGLQVRGFRGTKSRYLSFYALCRPRQLLVRRADNVRPPCRSSLTPRSQKAHDRTLDNASRTVNSKREMIASAATCGGGHLRAPQPRVRSALIFNARGFRPARRAAAVASPLTLPVRRSRDVGAGPRDERVPFRTDAVTPGPATASGCQLLVAENRLGTRRHRHTLYQPTGDSIWLGGHRGWQSPPGSCFAQG